MAARKRSGHTLRRILLGLLILILVLIGTIYLWSGRILSRKVTLPTSQPPLHVPTDSTTRAWGHHLATAILVCADCHGPDFQGVQIIDAPVFARLASSNLTPGRGGLPPDYGVVDFERALRHSVGRDGRALWLMPAHGYCYLADEDVAALYHYIRTLPPVDHQVLPRKLGPVGRMLMVQGKLPIAFGELVDHRAPRPRKPRPEPTVEYGQYLARISCSSCHGPNLSGGEIYGAPPEFPPASNLTRGGIAAEYTKEDFFRAMREGVRPGGAKLHPHMPSHLMRFMTDDELNALWAYLQTQRAPYGSGNWAAVRVP